MGVLSISRKLIANEELIGSMFHYLREQHEASYEPVGSNPVYVTFWVEGEGIPKGHKEFTVTCEEIVPGVLRFQIHDH
jgi:hypothetical protein